MKNVSTKQMRTILNCLKNLLWITLPVFLLGLYINFNNVSGFTKFAMIYGIIFGLYLIFIVILENYVDEREYQDLINGISDRCYQLVIFGDVINFPINYSDSRYQVTLVGLKTKTYNVTKKIYEELKNNNQHIERWTYC